MKKIIFLLISITTFLFGSIGSVTVAKGDVKVNRDSKVLAVVSRMSIEKKDTFTLGKDAKAQLKFDDGTVISLGRDTTFSVEEFIADEAQAKAEFSIGKGIFRAMTGQIGKLAPDKFKVKVKNATIGIRGTIFGADASGESTDIACTQGAISVTVDGKSVDVDAGQMVMVSSSGAISAVQQISDGFLKSISFKDKEKIKEMVEQITQIDNAELRRAAEDKLNDALYTAFHQYLDDNFYRVTPPASFQSGFVPTASYEGIVWGFYTKDKVDWSLGEDFEQKLAFATPVQTWMSTQGGDSYTELYTSADTITSYIGYSDETGDFAPHWEWSDTTRKLGIYEGKVLAVSDYNSVFDEESLPSDSALLSAIDAIATNETTLRVDYGNKSFHALIKFDIADNKNGDTDSWYVYVVGTGEAHVSPTGLKEVAYMSADGSETLSSAEFTLRYLGPTTEQIVSTFNFFNTNESVTYGNLVFNNVSLIDLSAQKLSNDADFEWGYWASGPIQSGASEEDILALEPNGAWIKPINGLEETDPSVIANLVGSGSQLVYNGSIIGTVYETLNQTTTLMKNGTANLDFNFATQTYSGNLAFGAGSDTWDMKVNNILINANVLSASSFTPNESHTAGTPFYGELNGKFYGSSAQNVAGGFEVMSINPSDKNIKTAIGAFSVKQ